MNMEPLFSRSLKCRWVGGAAQTPLAMPSTRLEGRQPTGFLEKEGIVGRKVRPALHVKIQSSGLVSANAG